MRHIVAALVGTLFATFACVASDAQNVAPLADPGAAPTARPRSLPPIESSAAVDAAFLTAAIQGNNAELDMSELALKRGHADEVLGFAEIMLTDHVALEKRFDALGMRAASAPRENDVDRLALTRLAHAQPADFDQQYLEQQVGDHLATISLFTTEAKEGANPALRRFAADELSMLQSHLQLAVENVGHIGGSTPFSAR